MSDRDLDTRDRIFKVAAQLFAQKGFNGVSMRELSEQSGVSKPTIYYYFGSKEGIYRALLQAGIEHIRAEVTRIAAMNLSVRDELVEILKMKFRDCQAYPEYSKFFISVHMSMENLSFIDDFRRRTDEPMLKLENLLQRGAEGGEFRSDIDVKMAADLFGSTIMFHIWRLLESRTSENHDALAEKIVDTLFNGLRKNTH